MMALQFFTLLKVCNEIIKNRDIVSSSTEVRGGIFSKKAFLKLLWRGCMTWVTNDQIMPVEEFHNCIFQQSEHCKSENFL